MCRCVRLPPAALSLCLCCVSTVCTLSLFALSLLSLSLSPAIVTTASIGTGPDSQCFSLGSGLGLNDKAVGPDEECVDVYVCRTALFVSVVC